MKKIVITCGLISGFITTSWTLSFMLVAGGNSDTDFESGTIYGYASMILAFSLIYVGVRNFRNKHNGGVISFGKAFRMGLYITLIASTLYVVAWLVTYYCFMPDFGKVWSEHVLKTARASGASAAVIAQKTAEMADFDKMLKNPFINALMAYSEILPVGLVATLITAFILKRKRPVDNALVAGERI
jgi:hypothetical protein